MGVLAVGGYAFGAVVIIVCVVGVVVALVLQARQRDTFDREMGGLWIFHGTADTSPHQMPGMRFEERHVIDPPPSPGPTEELAGAGAQTLDRGRPGSHER